MWLDTNQFEDIKTALHAGKRSNVASLLDSLIRNVHAREPRDICPLCNEKLVKKSLPYLELFSVACPEGHGFWVGREAASAMHEFISEQISITAKKKQTRLLIQQAAFCVLLVLLTAQVWSSGANPVAHLVQMPFRYMNDMRINVDYWPARSISRYYHLPAKDTVIQKEDEHLYFSEVVSLLNDGISNRLNIESALNVKRSGDDYLALYDIYLEKQTAFVDRLEKLSVPEAAKTFHKNLVGAAHAQILFYADYTYAKLDDPSVDLTDLLDHGELISTDSQLWAAYYAFRDLYPNRDKATNDAIERRLCWFDVV